MSAVTRYTLPAMFALDWLNRMDGEHIVPDMQSLIIRPQSAKGTTVVLELSLDQRSDLLADAKHYADDVDDYFDESVRSLCKSAKRVVAAIERQAVTA